MTSVGDLEESIFLHGLALERPPKVLCDPLASAIVKRCDVDTKWRRDARL